ncbi:hypothetical protein ABL78_2888 [Leptomonas seymouri]|uniref:Uncharacterized protein n=1 Tax=Leptomonas seymouri TaxID=5684 RepID=A0A0N1PC69_LEPSE|nr:hypothetical protein ABL78_2888 [Leptomonas seymouri]|eukprot:KPI88012.1 hypothetical protein ABL78_2888 [Leptomonas seymouri]
MPAEEKPPTQPLSRSSSDSVDLAEFVAANQLRSPGWLSAVRHAQSPVARPVAARNATTMDFTSHSNNMNSDTTPPTTQGGGSTLVEYTPATSRYPADATAMGSPIPVDTDNSDANVNQLVSRLTSLGAGKRAGAHTVLNAVSGGRMSGGTAGPRCRRTPPPAPTPAGDAPQAESPPVERPFAGGYVPDPPARCRFSSGNGEAASQASIPTAVAASGHLERLIPQQAYASSLLGLSHGATARAEQTLPIQQYSDQYETTMTTDVSPHPSTYSSALMQALSRMEGAAALTSHWNSTTQPSRTDADADEQDDGATGGSACPPDIYEEAMRAKVAKQQWMALERARQEVLEEARRRRDCPFAPQVSPYAARLQRPASLRPESRVQSEMISRKQWVAKKQQQQVERELRECTFRPLTVRTARLGPAALAPAGSAVFHNLYAEAEDRRVFEEEIKPHVIREMEGRVQPSPMRPEQLAEVVERLCARGVTRTTDSAPREGEGTDAALCAAPPTGSAAPDAADKHQPLLSTVSQRIVAAQVAAGERDPNIVRHLYRQAERDAIKDQLRLELNAEKEHIARVEQAEILAQNHRRLKQEHYRSVLAAKYRALSKYVCETQHTSYRATAPQSVVLLARASFDLLTADETEELLSAVEHCGQHKLREAEFVAVVFRHFAELQVAPANAALLSRPPPASAVVGNGAANAKRASSVPRIGGSGNSTDGSPLNIPKVKREKPDPELIAQIRESRAHAFEEWKAEHLHRRAIADGVATDEGCTFQPAPRRLIPYECRPDVIVPVKTTKSEALRRAYIASHQQEANVPDVPAPSLRANTDSPTGRTSAAQPAPTARELFSQPPPTAKGTDRVRDFSYGALSRARSRSGAAAAALGAAAREGSAARSGASPAPRPQSQAASVGADGPSPSPPQTGSLKSGQQTTSSIKKLSNAALASYRMGAPLSTSSTKQPRRPPPPPQQQQTLTPTPAVHHDAVNPSTVLQPAVSTGRPRRGQSATSVSLLERIMNSTPEERACLGRELLLRQLRDHQRRRAV